MKALKFIAFLLLCSSLQYNNPKSFEIIGSATNNISINVKEKVELSEIRFKNTTNHDLILSWETTSMTFPKEWDFSMCAFGKCQVGIPKKGELRKISSGKIGFIAIHVFPRGKKGNGLVKFKLTDPISKKTSKELTFKVKVH